MFESPDKNGTGRGLHKSPDKIGLAERKKSPHKDPFCQNRALRGLLGVLPWHIRDSESILEHGLLYPTQYHLSAPPSSYYFLCCALHRLAHLKLISVVTILAVSILRREGIV